MAKESATKFCAQCDNTQPTYFKFCPECGTELTHATWVLELRKSEAAEETAPRFIAINGL